VVVEVDAEPKRPPVDGAAVEVGAAVVVAGWLEVEGAAPNRDVVAGALEVGFEAAAPKRDVVAGAVLAAGVELGKSEEPAGLGVDEAVVVAGANRDPAGAADEADVLVVVAGVLLGKNDEPGGFSPVELASAGFDAAAPKRPPDGAVLAGVAADALLFCPRFEKRPPPVEGAAAVLLLPKMLDVLPLEAVAVVDDAGAAEDVLLFPTLEKSDDVGAAVEVVLFPVPPAALVPAFPNRPPDEAGFAPKRDVPLLGV
jgi:hypothetical protein